MFCSSRSQSWRNIRRGRLLSQFQLELTWDRRAMHTKTRRYEGGGGQCTQPRRCTLRLDQPHRSRCTLLRSKKTFSNGQKIQFFSQWKNSNKTLTTEKISLDSPNPKDKWRMTKISILIRSPVISFWEENDVKEWPFCHHSRKHQKNTC